MLIVVIVLLVALVLGAALAWRLTQPRSLIIQWGRFESERAGLKDRPGFSDEPDVVDFVDFRYWIRLKPNPGVNLPVFGYWSAHRGRSRGVV